MGIWDTDCSDIRCQFHITVQFHQSNIFVMLQWTGSFITRMLKYTSNIVFVLITFVLGPTMQNIEKTSRLPASHAYVAVAERIRPFGWWIILSPEWFILRIRRGFISIPRSHKCFFFCEIFKSLKSNLLVPIKVYFYKWSLRYQTKLTQTIKKLKIIIKITFFYLLKLVFYK